MKKHGQPELNYGNFRINMIGFLPTWVHRAGYSRGDADRVIAEFNRIASGMNLPVTSYEEIEGSASGKEKLRS